MLLVLTLLIFGVLGLAREVLLQLNFLIQDIRRLCIRNAGTYVIVLAFQFRFLELVTLFLKNSLQSGIPDAYCVYFLCICD